MTSLNVDTGAGIVGGTLFALFLQIKSVDMVKTAILTAIAAIVSFGVSLALKELVKWLRRPGRSERSGRSQRPER